MVILVLSSLLLCGHPCVVAVVALWSSLCGCLCCCVVVFVTLSSLVSVAHCYLVDIILNILQVFPVYFFVIWELLVHFHDLAFLH